MTTTSAPRQAQLDWQDVAVYVAMGTLFGIILTKGEVISWFRIQEMFRFQSFHMYGVIATAIAVAAVSLIVLRRLEARSLKGDPIEVSPKPYERGYNQWAGGIVFGLGWALTGACPGPLYALIGNGISVILVALASAAAGAWAYGALRPRLPH